MAFVVPFRDDAAALHGALLSHGALAYVFSSVAFDQSADAQSAPIVEQQTFLSRAHRLAQDAPLQVVLVGRHPMRVYDEQVISAVQALSAGSSLDIILALDDALLSLASGSVDRLRRLIQTLGMPEDEAIEHGAVSRSVESLQESVAKRVRAEQPASSFERWRELNLP